MPPSEPNGVLGGGTSTGSAFNTLSFKVVKPKWKKRKQFDLTRCQEVKDVREIRACLRCSLLRIRCSPGDLCTRCKDLVFHTHEKLTLSFSGCIRTRLVEVSVFEDAIPPAEIRDSVLLKTSNLALKSITLNFARQITWNLPALVDDIVDWLNGPQISTTSKVGTLSSPNFMELIEPHVGFENMLSFQRMLYAESLAYIQPTTEDQHHFSIRELQQIGAITGHSFLKFLDDKLRPQSLKHCSKEDLQALFLLVVGTILAVGYTDPVVDGSEPFKMGTDNSVQVHQAQLQAMQDHVCQILAHYVVYLGSQLSLPIATHVEQFILEAAVAKWDKEGNFEWLTTPGEELEPRASPEGNAHLPTNFFSSFSDPYFGSPSLSHENPRQSVLDPLLPVGNLKTTSGPSKNQTPYFRSTSGGVENTNVVLDNLPTLENHQGTLSVSKAALESFHHWDSRWDGRRISRNCSVQINGMPFDGFVLRGSWGVLRNTFPVNLDLEHDPETQVDDPGFTAKVNNEGHTFAKTIRSKLHRLKKKVALLV